MHESLRKGSARNMTQEEGQGIPWYAIGVSAGELAGLGPASAKTDC